jgi:hypothetical protein
MAQTKAKKDQDRFIQQPHKMIKSDAYLKLSGNAIKALSMLETFYWPNKPEVSCSHAAMAQMLKCSKTTAGDALNQLVQAGFLVVVKESDNFNQQARTYRLSYKKYHDTPPTNEWQDGQ